ncbi:hypothetical protein G6O69_23310 [Pseudenhygromyxa sp. WMMC2535]|uniref:hypothetical protein n=1 Tax=Pseudenhygromyxa sp. WMMC2535 TaxID=2712867 RepID=UPI0015558333|nr:hypothetical protein [Pseudenhygromyxa sp. WMMC2535]NVB40788.1 hypothetical protein [Pseudenhygromyxa sp. WMMC2535]
MSASPARVVVVFSLIASLAVGCLVAAPRLVDGPGEGPSYAGIEREADIPLPVAAG